MCGIFGMINYGNHLNKSEISGIYNSFANVCIARGEHAAGIAYVSDQDLIIKKDTRSFCEAAFTHPENTKILMAHCRLSLEKDYLENKNNHPFEGETLDHSRFALAHNGILCDLRNIRKDLQLPTTDIVTDSYVAAQILNTQSKLDFESLKNMCEHLQGSYSFTVLDEANHLFFCRGDVPIYLVHFKKLKLYLYLSTRDLFEQALAQTSLNESYITSNLEWELSDVRIVPIAKGEILRITDQGEISRGQFAFCEEKAISHNWYLHEITPSKRLTEQLEHLGN
ncbi:hypothetical protein FACS1894111_04410 [Clostridia bacterium]|nr:hypothetical protein FACS1894111_04410 [Clostridia bacterium]